MAFATNKNKKSLLIGFQEQEQNRFFKTFCGNRASANPELALAERSLCKFLIFFSIKIWLLRMLLGSIGVHKIP